MPLLRGVSGEHPDTAGQQGQLESQPRVANWCKTFFCAQILLSRIEKSRQVSPKLSNSHQFSNVSEAGLNSAVGFQNYRVRKSRYKLTMVVWLKHFKDLY